MKYWLMKSEPDVWSIDQQRKAGAKGAAWDGVRNYQARNNLMNMKKKDLCFFYHSVSEKLIIGIVEVVKEHYPDPTDKTGFTIFKILGSAQTVILTLFCQAINPMNIKKNRLAIIFFIVHLSFIF